MARFTLSLFSLTILSLTYTAVANNFIEMSCKKTTHPAECTQALTAQAAAIGQSPMKIAEIALSIAQTKSQELSKYLDAEAKKPGLGPREQAAMKDCLETMEDIIEQLTKSTEEMSTMAKSADKFMFHKSNVQTWISSVLSDHTTCLEGFSETSADQRLTEAIKVKVVEAERDTSIALALINQLQAPV